MSQDPCSRSVLIACLLLPIRSAAMRRVSSGESVDIPSTCTGTRCPYTSTWGARPGEKIRSLTFSDARNIALRSAWVGTAPGPWTPSKATEIGAMPGDAIPFPHTCRNSWPQKENNHQQSGGKLPLTVARRAASAKDGRYVPLSNLGGVTTSRLGLGDVTNQGKGGPKAARSLATSFF